MSKKNIIIFIKSMSKKYNNILKVCQKKNIIIFINRKLKKLIILITAS